MSFFDNIADMLGFGVDEEQDEQEELQDEDVMPKPKKEKTPKKSAREDKVVNINTTTKLEVVLVKPENYEESLGIADKLISKRSVVLNLESTNKDVARRMVDFLAGVAYALNGNIKRVANSTFIITPYNVALEGEEIMGELENSGAFYY